MMRFIGKTVAVVAAIALIMGTVGCSSGSSTASSQSSAESSQAQSASAAQPSLKLDELLGEKTESSSVPVSSEPEPEAETEEYPWFAQILLDDNWLCGVSYLGWFEPRSGAILEGSYEQPGYLETYSFIEEIPDERKILYEGEEVYCIVPSAHLNSITAVEWIVPVGADQGYAGEVLYYSEDEQPFLLQCNSGNVQLILEGTDGSEYLYFPSMDMMYGRLFIGDLSMEVLDFTQYPEGAPVPGSEENFETVTMTMEDLQGNWASLDTGDIICMLEIYPNQYDAYLHHVRSVCADTEGNMISVYEGYAYNGEALNDEPHPENLMFQMELVEGEGEQEFAGWFSVSYASDETIVVAHNSGDPLFEGTEGMRIEFGRAYG